MSSPSCRATLCDPRQLLTLLAGGEEWGCGTRQSIWSVPNQSPDCTIQNLQASSCFN